jgi:hypothetical protein
MQIMEESNREGILLIANKGVAGVARVSELAVNSIQLSKE